MDHSINLAAQQRAHCQQMKASEVPMKPVTVRLEKELREKAERQSKVAAFKAEKLFREEVDLKAEKARKETIRLMRYSMSMMPQQLRHSQQMKSQRGPH